MAVDERSDRSRIALRAAAQLRRPRSSRTPSAAAAAAAKASRDFDLNVEPAVLEQELVSRHEEHEILHHKQTNHRQQQEEQQGEEQQQQEQDGAIEVKRRKHRPKVVALTPPTTTTSTSTTATKTSAPAPAPARPRGRPPKPTKLQPNALRSGSQAAIGPRPRKRRKQEVLLSSSISIGSEGGGAMGFALHTTGPQLQSLVLEQRERIEQLVAQELALQQQQQQLLQRAHAQRQARLEKTRKRQQEQSVEEGVEALVRLFNGLSLLEDLSLVPFAGAGAIVPVSTRTKKPRAKVRLDPESTRVWKLLMANEGESDETTKNWEKERLSMKQKALCFIEKMHLIQGNRKFSKWKGSVVDSVIGAFLTQNVSDHLSSSAFMAMAARFPVKHEGDDATCSFCSCSSCSCVAQDVVPAQGQQEEQVVREHCCTNQDVLAVPAQGEQEQVVPGLEKGNEEEEDAFLEGRRKVRRALFAESGDKNQSVVVDVAVATALDQQQQQQGDDSSSNGSCLTEVSVAATTITTVSSGEEKENKTSNNTRARKATAVTGKERALLEQTRGSTKKSYDWESIKSKVRTRGPGGPKPPDSADWQAVRLAETKEVADVIKERGMNNVLAGRMKGFLDRVYEEHGSIDLEWIRDVPPQDAKDFLLSIRGLGLKSVECIRLLALDHLAFPVDTNVGRILVRLGWVPIQPLPEELELHLLELYPVQETVQKYIWPRLCTLDRLTLYELHYQMITFGKVFCTKTRPNCNACPMRMECRHFASAYASAKLALPAPPSQQNNEAANGGQEQQQQQQQLVLPLPPPVLPPLTNAVPPPQEKCEPIIEEPQSPEPESCESSSACPDMEDLVFSQGNETLHLNLIETADAPPQYSIASASRELMVLPPEFAYIPVPKLKNVFRLRTVHYVYELPDNHQLVQQLLDPRDKDDPCFYLLALWSQDEQAQDKQPENQNECCDEECVKGTLLIPCRTAMRGSFPLNGTYFQVNEVFADSETGNHPLFVPRRLLWNLPRKFVYFGTSVPAIFRGLTADEVQACFWKGYVCVRGFDRKSRSPRPLAARLHLAPSNRKGQYILNDGDE